MGSFNLQRSIHKRINIPYTSSSPVGLIDANTIDPWSQSGKYGLGWTYLCIVLVVLVIAIRIYHFWTDKLRQALYKEDQHQHQANWRTSPNSDHCSSPDTGTTMSTVQHFKHELEIVQNPAYQHSTSSISIVNHTLALFRWVFYRPVAGFNWRSHILSMPSLGVIVILVIASIFVILYCFVPQPLYWQSIRYGSPPVAIRAGMISIAMTPWIVATATKGNLISLVTGISHERLGVFHRWLAYLCTLLVLIHIIPFYVQPVWKDGGLTVFTSLISVNGIIYGTGICVFVPLCWLVVGSLPLIRRYFHEVFLVSHIPISFLYVALLFWHTQNNLTSWAYLYATCVIWIVTYIIRALKLNWLAPWRKLHRLIGDECSMTLMNENAIKITIPTRMRWRPGQFVYLRIPSISFLQNHPFTISSLCSDDFASDYGEDYRDCVIVFRPFSGFTKRVLEEALDNLPRPYVRPKTYRAFLEGPYGGMTRELPAFDTVIMFAGGSGITAVVSQLLDLVKRMRDGKAVTRKVIVIWALKDLGALEWFKEELQICVESAPHGCVTCSFYVTGNGRRDIRQHDSKPDVHSLNSHHQVGNRQARPLSTQMHDKFGDLVNGIAEKRFSALIQDEAMHDPAREGLLRAEERDIITSLPLSDHHCSPPPPVYLPRTEVDSIRSGGNTVKYRSLEKLENDHKYISGNTYGMTRTDIPLHDLGESPELLALRYPPPTRKPPKIQTQFTHRPMSLSSSTLSSDASAYTASTQSSSVELIELCTPPKVKTAHAAFRTPLSLHIPKGRSSTYMPSYNDSPPLRSVTYSQTRPAVSSSPPQLMPRAKTTSTRSIQQQHALSPAPYTVYHERPNLSGLLHDLTRDMLSPSQNILGRRTCIFVCGPPSMRLDVAGAVAALQTAVWRNAAVDEVFLWTENYNV